MCKYLIFIDIVLIRGVLFVFLSFPLDKMKYMKRFKEIRITPRFVAGTIIAIHGLLRILFINKYIDFVLINFNDFIPSELLLTIGSSLMPFIEFFAGLLLLFNVSIKQSTWLGIWISIIMSAFIIAAGMYTRLIYHVDVVVVLSMILMQKQLKKSNQNLLEGPKSKIDAWSKYFFLI